MTSKEAKICSPRTILKRLGIEEEDDDITVQSQVPQEQSKVALTYLGRLAQDRVFYRGCELAYAQDLFLTLKAAVEAAFGNSSRRLSDCLLYNSTVLTCVALFA